jgi:hypothetical protein
VAFRAIDKDDNAEVARSLTVAVDATAPVIQVATTPASIKANGKAQAVKITGSAADATSGLASYAIAVTNLAGKVVATARSFGSTVSLVGQKGQRYTVTVVALDKAGNRATATAVIPVN